MVLAAADQAHVRAFFALPSAYAMPAAVATGLTTGLINNDIDVTMFRGITGTGRPGVVS